MNKELIEALKKIAEAIYNQRIEHPDAEADLYEIEMDVYKLCDRFAALQSTEATAGEGETAWTDDDVKKIILLLKRYYSYDKTNWRYCQQLQDLDSAPPF